MKQTDVYQNSWLKVTLNTKQKVLRSRTTPRHAQTMLWRHMHGHSALITSTTNMYSLLVIVQGSINMLTSFRDLGGVPVKVDQSHVEQVTPVC